MSVKDKLPVSVTKSLNGSVIKQSAKQLAPAENPPNCHNRLLQNDWTDGIPDDQWKLYRCVWEEARRRNIPFALGGAMALATYIDHWRNTKDLDFYVLPQDRERMIEVLSHCGLTDYFSLLPYERHWIYRGHDEGVIVDVIWAMANRRWQIDELWLSRSRNFCICGESLPVAAPEELLWGKLYVMQRERCDWPDIFNLIYAAGPTMDWDHLIARVGEDKPLLRGLLSVFSWLSPERARELPSFLWGALELPQPDDESTLGDESNHVSLLDTRQWFFAAEHDSQ